MMSTSWHGCIDGALAWADVIILTGGLGPTEDDITRDAVARVLNLSMDVDEQIVDRIRERFARRGLTMPEINRRQGMVPRGATVIENRNGTAPGLWLERGRTAIVLLPGPPREMTPMLDAVTRDRLTPRTDGRGLFRRVLKITGRTESDVDAAAQPVLRRGTSAAMPISTTILAALGQIELHLTAAASDRAAANATLDAGVRELEAVLGSAVCSTDGRPLEAVVGDMLRERGMTIAVAGVVLRRIARLATDGRAGQLGLRRAGSRLLQQPRQNGAGRRPRVADRRARRRPASRSRRAMADRDPPARARQRRHRHHRNRRAGRRLARETGGDGRDRGGGRRPDSRPHLSVSRRTRHGEVSVGAGRDEHAAAAVAQERRAVLACDEQGLRDWGLGVSLGIRDRKESREESD